MKQIFFISQAQGITPTWHRPWLGMFVMVMMLVLVGACSTAVTQDQAASAVKRAPAETGSPMQTADQSSLGTSTAQVAVQAPVPVPSLPPAENSGYAEVEQPSQTPPASSAAKSAEGFTPEAPRLTYTNVQVPGPYVAITFDDGPHPQNTPRLLDILKERGIKATFYLVGQNVAEYPEIVARMVAEGHEVGNHSWSHPFFTKMSESAVRSQLQRTHDAIVQASGVAPTTLRPPYGAITASQKKWIADDFGYPTIMWSVDPLDWKNRNATTVTQRIVSGASQGDIILAHDIHKSTIDAMPGTLDALLAKGYRFETVSNLIRRSQTPLASTSPQHRNN